MMQTNVFAFVSVLIHSNSIAFIKTNNVFQSEFILFSLLSFFLWVDSYSSTRTKIVEYACIMSVQYA